MHCGACGAPIRAGDRYCRDCGQSVSSEQDAALASEPVRGDVYGGFWRRGVAGLVDALILIPLALLLDATLLALGMSAWLDLLLLGLASKLTYYLLSATYYAVFESSAMRATPGKRLLGMAVVDENGDRLGIGQAYGREFAKLISILLLGIGVFMIAVTARRQGLHDKLAGTRVVNRGVDDRLVMQDPVAPSPNVLSVVLAFVLVMLGFALPPVLRLSGHKSLADMIRHQDQSGMAVGVPDDGASQQVYAMKMESAQAMDAIFDYIDAHDRWPSSLTSAGFSGSHTDTVRLVYDDNLRQVTAFARAGPLAGRSLQRRVVSVHRTDGQAKEKPSYNVVCMSPDIPNKLLPLSCRD